MALVSLFDIAYKKSSFIHVSGYKDIILFCPLLCWPKLISDQLKNLSCKRMNLKYIIIILE